MKTTAIATLAAAILPCMAASKAFTLQVASTGSLDNGLPIVAWNGQLIAGYAGSSTTATCPDHEDDCPAKNTTIFSGPALNSSATQLWMGVLQDNGQRVYMHAAPKEAFFYGYGDLVSYTAAGINPDANVPKVDTFEDLFRIIQYPDTGSSYGAKAGDIILTPKSQTIGVFGLCSIVDPAGGTLHRLTTATKGCSPVNLVVKEIDITAPQFYNCDGCEFRGDCRNYPACGAPFCSDTKPKYL